MRVLVIEGYRLMAKALQQRLVQEGFAVDTVHDAQEGKTKTDSTIYDVIVLDLSSTGSDGFALLGQWKEAALPSHILGLTSRNQHHLEEQALHWGARECLTKPFAVDDLLKRIHVPTKTNGTFQSHPKVTCQDLEIDLAMRTVKRSGRKIDLTRREYDFLEFLAKHQGKIVSRPMIWEHVYGSHEKYTSNVVEVYIRHLRRKIDKGFDSPLILTHWGKGYMLRGNGDGVAE